MIGASIMVCVLGALLSVIPSTSSTIRSASIIISVSKTLQWHMHSDAEPKVFEILASMLVLEYVLVIRLDPLGRKHQDNTGKKE
jgi:hypothetical protein